MARSLASHPFASGIRLSLGAASAAFFALLSGCGSEVSPRTPVVPVEGEVRVEGKLPHGALVVFHPVIKDEKTPAPRALVDQDGKFKLSTYDAQDGAPVGEYQVTVTWRPLIKRDGDFVPGPNQTPNRFTQVQTTPLRVRIAADSNRLEPFLLRK